MAVHQCEKYQVNPKRSHEQDVKIIVRYIIGKNNKGIIINPNGNTETLEGLCMPTLQVINAKKIKMIQFQ